MRHELGTLFWLQFKLTWAMFRTRRTEERIRALLFVLKVLSFVFTIPLFVAMGVGLAMVSILFLSPQATYEIVILVNNFMFFIWLLLPASYSSQIVERFQRHQPVPLEGRMVQGQDFEVLEQRQMQKIRVLDAAVTQVERAETAHLAQVLKSGAGHLRPLQNQDLEILEGLQVFQSLVCDFAVVQVQSF